MAKASAVATACGDLMSAVQNNLAAVQNKTDAELKAFAASNAKPSAE